MKVLHLIICINSYFLLPFFTTLSCADEIPITLEYAKTEKERSFGLMQRTHLKKDHGMLFVYPKETIINIWMLNCLIDLSVAFLNDKGEILEMYELKAYPEKIERSLKNYEELAAYHNNKVFSFFLKQSIKSSFPATFALEMDKGWFKEHHIKKGDVLRSDLIIMNAYIERKN